MPNQKEEAERRASPAEAARESQSGEEASRRRVVEMTARSRSHSSISDVSRSRSRSPHSPRRPADERSQAPLDAESSQRFPKRPPTSENKVLAVFGLHLDVTELELDGLYRPYGAKFCKIIWDKYKNMSKGFGFIYFDNVADAVKAKNATEGLKLKNKEFRLDYSLGERDYSTMVMSRRSPPSPPQSLERRRRHDSRERPAPYHHRPFDYERRPPVPHRHAPPDHHHHHMSRGHPGAHPAREHYNNLPQRESYRAPRDADQRYSREIRRYGEAERSRGRFDYREETARYVPPAHQSRSTYSNGSNNSSRHSMAMTPPSPRSPRFARHESASRSRSRSREYRHARQHNHHQRQEESRLIRA